MEHQHEVLCVSCHPSGPVGVRGEDGRGTHTQGEPAEEGGAVLGSGRVLRLSAQLGHGGQAEAVPILPDEQCDLQHMSAS